MIESMSETRPPPIPAVLRLRARYRGNRAAYAADKRRRSMGLFRRPTMGDRLDNAAEKKWWQSQGPGAKDLAKVEAAMDETERRKLRRQVDNHRPYRGSRDEEEHRRRGRR